MRAVNYDRYMKQQNIYKRWKYIAGYREIFFLYKLELSSTAPSSVGFLPG